MKNDEDAMSAAGGETSSGISNPPGKTMRCPAPNRSF
jgi:hypothetical protein